jgi:cytochrome c peroxidase
VLLLPLLASCRGGGGGAALAAVAPAGGLSPAGQVGKSLFFDESLSRSGKMACSTCHDPAHAYGPPNGLAVQRGGPAGDRPGTRAVPSLRYKEYTPSYADLLENPDGMSAPGPGGGFTWDGRASTLAAQARLPLLSPLEMANDDPAQVVARVNAAPYAALFHQVFGAQAEGPAAFDSVLAALQSFQLEDPSFHPYTSKFDLYSGNKIGGALTAAELRGARVFSDPRRGNCGSCHFSGPGLNGSSGLFTDFSYEAIGVPRNREIPANGDERYYDLGICGPLRADHDGKLCGMFKTPTLRNVATRSVFFHNGVIHSLEKAVRFYNTRDTNPELWYPKVGRRVQKFDDLPPAYRDNIDPQGPLDGRPAGARPPMSEREVADLLCFLRTLTDDYRPPAQASTSGPCVE